MRELLPLIYKKLRIDELYDFYKWHLDIFNPLFNPFGRWFLE